MRHNRERIRIAVDVSKSDPPIDALTGQTPDIWAGTDIQIELGFFWGNPLAGGIYVDDISNLSSITLLVRDYATRKTTTYINKTINPPDINYACTLDQWTAGTSQQAIITLTNAETNLTMTGVTQDYWMVFSAITNDGTPRKITLGGGKLTLNEDGDTAATTPGSGDPTYLTASQVQALLAGYLPASGKGDIIRISPNGQWARRWGVDDTGQRFDDIRKLV